MTDRPSDDGKMFFVGMKFVPTERLKQSELNRVVVQLFRRYFVHDNKMIPVKHDSDPMLSLVQFLVDIDFILDENAFNDLPDDLKHLFVVKKRDGSEHRYGQKSRW